MPDPRRWSASNHELLPMPVKKRVHMAVALLWTLRNQGKQMSLPYELLEITLKHAV
jgi:hypothetical protein